MNSLNHAKKMVKKMKTNYPKTKIVLSEIITHKDKKGIHKRSGDTNSWLKNYYLQKKYVILITLRRGSHIDFRTQRDRMTLTGEGKEVGYH